MGLLDEIKGAAAHGGARCVLHTTVREALSDDDFADLEAVIADPSYTAAQIARALRARDVEASDGLIQRHRREGCKCEHR